MEVNDMHVLASEYLNWTKKYGNGRNEKDLRFGQYICNLTGITNSKIYNEENATKAYMLLIDEPYEGP